MCDPMIESGAQNFARLVKQAHGAGGVARVMPGDGQVRVALRRLDRELAAEDRVALGQAVLQRLPLAG